MHALTAALVLTGCAVASADTGTAPVAITIPALGLDVPLIGLGIDAAGRMEVPADVAAVGWFTGGGMPGGRGPTVVAAHVDGPDGPGAFSRLHVIGVDDQVVLTDNSGTRWVYRVGEVLSVPKSAFPTMRVFGAVAADQLRLITCGGYFDPAAGHYDQNLIVFAELDHTIAR